MADFKGGKLLAVIGDEVLDYVVPTAVAITDMRVC